MEVGKGEHNLIAHCIMERLVEIILGIHILASIAAADSVDQTGRALVDMTAALSEGRDDIAKVHLRGSRSHKLHATRSASSLAPSISSPTDQHKMPFIIANVHPACNVTETTTNTGAQGRGDKN